MTRRLRQAVSASFLDDSFLREFEARIGETSRTGEVVLHQARFVIQWRDYRNFHDAAALGARRRRVGFGGGHRRI